MRQKALAAVDALGLDLGIASEGSFGAHPYIPFAPGNVETVILLDGAAEPEIRGVHIATAVRFMHAWVASVDEAFAFAAGQAFRNMASSCGGVRMIRMVCAGGRASDDALRSLVISTAILGVRTILVIQHTGCGLTQSDNRGFREQIGDVVGTDPGNYDFLPIADLSQSVRDDVATIREHPLLTHGITVAGFIPDIDTGHLESVA